MAVVATFLYQHGITVFPYIDDWLLISHSLHHLCQDMSTTLQLLASLGLCVNLAKSHLTLVQDLQFIGAQIFTPLQHTFLPMDRASMLRSLALSVLSSPTQSALVL